MTSWIAIAVCCSLSAPPADAGGVIEGVVENGSRGQAPVEGAEIVLRADQNGVLVPIAKTTSDDEGRFRFEQLPGAGDLVCLPGANYQGVHYPGHRVSLDGRKPVTAQRIVVYETVADPNPLAAARHDIEIRPETGVLVVTETIVVANRTLRSYVGSETEEDQPSVTLRLSIPPEFEKVTFEKEFFGRQFQLNKGSLETQIPWTPGRRELKFTYRLPLDGRDYLFHRQLDLPTEYIRVKMQGHPIDDVTSNLTSAAIPQDASVLLESDGSTLPVGYAIEIELGSLSAPWTTYARWSALAILGLLVIVTSVFMFRRRHLPVVGTSEEAIAARCRSAA